MNIEFKAGHVGTEKRNTRRALDRRHGRCRTAIEKSRWRDFPHPKSIANARRKTRGNARGTYRDLGRLEGGDGAGEGGGNAGHVGV